MGETKGYLRGGVGGEEVRTKVVLGESLEKLQVKIWGSELFCLLE